ncbi:MAG: YvrJ family protein [Gracilibacteraceae bacterium]|nr:YvrJ family protein [Gracilibacteraceae bacterium]
MEGLEQFITSVGFPIAVTAFLLLRIEKKLEDLNNNLINMTEAFIKNMK